MSNEHFADRPTRPELPNITFSSNEVLRAKHGDHELNSWFSSVGSLFSLPTEALLFIGISVAAIFLLLVLIKVVQMLNLCGPNTNNTTQGCSNCKCNAGNATVLQPLILGEGRTLPSTSETNYHQAETGKSNNTNYVEELNLLVAKAAATNESLSTTSPTPSPLSIRRLAAVDSERKKSPELNESLV